MSEVRSPSVLTEPLSGGFSLVYTPSYISEPLSGGNPEVEVSSVLTELLISYANVVMANSVLTEVLIQAPEELNVSTTPFPGFGNSTTNPSIPQAADPFDSPLPGLTFSVNKKPMFKTRVSEAASGNEVRNSLAEYPRWEFTLRYDFLEDRTGADSSLKTIMGFFLSMRGSYDSWLFKDPDDYLVTNGWLGNSDGLTLQFPFLRAIGSFYEKVGQVDTSNTVTVFHSPDEAGTVPGVGPYTITVSEAASFVEDLGVTRLGVPLTRVTGAPGPNEYSVASGVYTFNSSRASQAMVISYRYTVDPADYTVILPNLIEFDSAPATGSVSASFQFFYACRFVEDELDFEKFMDSLWNLQECSFRSIIQ